MAEYCFDTLVSELTSKTVGKSENLPDTKMPLFVTWYKKVKGQYDLRGCIGTFSKDEPLKESLGEFALESAF